jgi:glycosyltransferase involved in cell wall biosynthesis
MVYVGRLSAEKGVDVLLRAVALVAAKRPNASLKIVGDGPERKNLEYLAAMLHLQDRVAFAGEQDAAAVGRTLREAALAVLPSLWVENCPMVALEALAAGTPVIGVRVGGIPDLIREGETGELFERGSARDLADTMVRALGDARWLRESRQRARHSAETEFSPERHYDRLMEIYESVIHRARK